MGEINGVKVILKTNGTEIGWNGVTEQQKQLRDNIIGIFKDTQLSFGEVLGVLEITKTAILEIASSTHL